MTFGDCGRVLVCVWGFVLVALSWPWLLFVWMVVGALGWAVAGAVVSRMQLRLAAELAHRSQREDGAS